MEGSYNSLSTNEKNVAQSFKALCRKGSESKIPNYWLHCFHHNILHAYKKKKKTFTNYNNVYLFLSVISRGILLPE